MDDIMAIAQSTASRVLRIKAVYFLLAIGICIIASGQLYGDITAGQQKTYTLDLGFLIVTLVGVLCAIVACFDLPRERREKTMVALLSRPLGRDRYLLGKFIGVCEIAFVCMAIMAVALIVISAQIGSGILGLEIVKGAVILFAGIVQLAAIGILLGTFLQEWLATIIALIIFWLVYALGALACTSKGVTHILLMLLPNFAMMSVRGLVVRGVELQWIMVLHALMLAAAYSLAMLVVAGFIFRRKDIA